jgi:hypothetical protein
VNCEVCGTELPHGALFCGECGRAVGTRTARTLHPDSGMPVEPAQSGTDAQPETGSPRTDGDEVQVVVASPRDTAIIQPVVHGALPELETEIPFIRQTAVRELDFPEPANPEPSIPEPAADVEQDLPPAVLAEEQLADEQLGDDLFAAEVVPEREVAPLRRDPFPWGDRGSKVFSDSDELEQTLIVPRRETGQRFVLQFSTGESVTVFGSGLLGRNPTPQPSEYFDQLVSITDPGKSVSKTHLEFGQDAGSFWVSDRFSGNGSTVREPESSPRRLVAGKRYRIVRGTRVDIGEQFFIVS